jgi:hypothetical protein
MPQDPPPGQTLSRSARSGATEHLPRLVALAACPRYKHPGQLWGRSLTLRPERGPLGRLQRPCHKCGSPGRDSRSRKAGEDARAPRT